LVSALIALAVGTGCGDSGDEQASTSAPATASQRKAQASAEGGANARKVERAHEDRSPAKALSPVEQQVERTATDFYSILGSEKAPKSLDETTIDSASFCELMSEAAVAQTIRYAKVSSGIGQKWDCESAIELLVIRSKRTGGFEGADQAKVIGINAQGGRASASVRFGNGAVTSLPLVKEDGEWKLASNSAAPAR
jgi:hypothetical protein